MISLFPIFLRQHLLFFTPDFHDGTISDLSSSLLYFNQSIIISNFNCRIPPYSDFTSYELDVDIKRPSIFLTNQSFCDIIPFREFSAGKSSQLISLFKSNPKLNRVDSIICMFFPSICQNFLPLNKTVIILSGHRFLLKRCSKKDVEAYIDLLTNSKADIRLLASNKYDKEYINYFTGLDVPVIYGSSLFLRYNTSMNNRYNRYITIAPFIQHKMHIRHIPFKAFADNLTKELGRYDVIIKHITKIISKPTYTIEDLSSLKAIIILPYAVFSYYMCDIQASLTPVFVPSPQYIVDNGYLRDAKNKDRWYCGRAYIPQKHNNSRHPFSPEEYSDDAERYWLRFAYFYTECSIIFDNITDLAYKIKHTNYVHVRRCNKHYNSRIKNQNIKEWSKLIHSIERHRVFPSSYDEYTAWLGKSVF